MTPRTNVRIWWDTSIQGYRLSSSFNTALVDALKAHIPASDRSYDPPTKIWTFTEKHFDNLVKLLKAIGVDPVTVSRSQTEQAQGGSQSTSAPAKSATLDSVLVTFMHVLPYDAAQAAYRKAAMLLHPDRGGSMEQMSALNVAWTRIEKELYPNK